MEKLTLNIYDDKGKVKKTLEANLIKIKFGQIRHILDLLKVEKMTDTMEILHTVNDAWEEVKEALIKIFPEATDEELDEVGIEELFPMLVKVVRYSFAEIVNNIPHEKN